MKFKYTWWGKGDIDASFGIFFDGFSKILSATGIMLFVFGMPAEIVLSKIVPGIGLAIFAGNLWYFYEARALAKKRKQTGCYRPAFWNRRISVDGMALFDHGTGLLADE